MLTLAPRGKALRGDGVRGKAGYVVGVRARLRAALGLPWLRADSYP